MAGVAGVCRAGLSSGAPVSPAIGLFAAVRWMVLAVL
jgi:hypothetical protein